MTNTNRVKSDYRNSKVETAVVARSFDSALAELAREGYRPISLAQNAQLRIEAGARHDISQNGNYVQEGILYVPKSKAKLVRISPIIASAKEATQAHRNYKEFYPSKEQIEQALTDSTDFPSKDVEIPTNRFGEEAFTVYAFGGEEQARKYGEFLKENGINTMPIWAVDKSYVDQQEKPFARQLWFHRLGFVRSYLIGNYRHLDGDDRTRGVRAISSKLSNIVKTKEDEGR